MDQLLSAIAIVSDPSQNRELQAQAIEYLNTIRTTPEQSWQLALNLFVDAKPDGSRAHVPQIRAFALQILDDLFNNRTQPLEQATNDSIKKSFISYIESEYAFGPAESSAPFIRNKFSHTLALTFISSYPDQWPDFFTFIYGLLQQPNPHPPTGLPVTAFNPQVTTLFLRLLIEISGEVADSIIKGAREFSEDRHRRDGIVRDHIRDRDSKTISDAVLTIVSDNEGHLVAVRNGVEPGNATLLEDLIALAVRAFASLIPWININFTVTPDTLPLLFRLLSDPAQSIRVETANSFLKMVLKGLKEPQDKVQLIRVLSLREVLTSVEEQTRGQEGNELFRESLGKLTNGLGLELCKLIEDGALPAEGRGTSQQLLNELLPVTLRFLADEWDEVSQSVHTLISTILGMYKRARKSGPHTHMTVEKRQFLSSLLEVSLQKMKWDVDTDVDDLDDDDRGAFDQMRKDLKTFMDHIINIDEDLVNSYIRQFSMTTLQQYQSGATVSWQDVELAVHLIYLYGEFQKGVKGVASFVQVPLELQRVAGKVDPNVKKPKLNYAEYPLTTHGELMMALIQSNSFAHPHPFVISQSYETVGRYGDFFKARKEGISPVLSAFIGTNGIHTGIENLRGRLFYLFHRFIHGIRFEIPQEIVTTILSNIGDLLILNVELPEEDSPQDDILASAVNTPSLFDSQIYLFETVGTLLSLLSTQPAEQLGLLQAITTPLLNALEQALSVQMLGPQDVLPVLKVHHLIRALGNISKGFPDAPSPTPQDYSTPVWVSVFESVADAIMVSLGRMGEFKIVREAARFAFSRIISATGPAITRFIPALMNSMLSTCKSDELADFINLLGFIVHKLQMEIVNVLDELIAPLYHHIANLMAQPADGTDAKRELVQTKKAYLDVLVSVMTTRLYVVFISERNKPLVEPVCQLVLSIATDFSDPPSQKSAWTLLARFTTHFGKTPAQFEITAAERAAAELPPEEFNPIPGYEGFIYDRLIPLAFELPNQPDFNVKDGQSLQVIGEVGTLIVATRKARGQEALDFYGNVFLPAKGWPHDAIATFLQQLVTLDTKNFKKYWTDFVRKSLTGATR